MSTLWIWVISKILIDVIKVTGVILNIPSTFLGITLLSLGISVPDLTLNCALAQSGYGEMGIAGSIAGPLSSLLMGLGASLIKITITSGPVEFNLFEYSDITILIGISILTLNLVRLLVQSIILKFKMTRCVSYIGYILYIIFFVGICVFTFVFTTNPF
jgi:Ca2+/Na+ antiporter